MFQKGDIVHRACLIEFEGVQVPAVVPGKIATVNPPRDGARTYHVRDVDWLGQGRTSFTTYAVAAISAALGCGVTTAWGWCR